ncbi:MAG: hypothetical protein KIS77_01955 [Saprospiraceae bacterium]|nr:hypothetical protein [Saprospiraceae bacterium]
MKKNRFLLLFFLLLAANAAVYFPSCQREADQPQIKPLSDKPVTERACVDDTGCSFVVTATANGTAELCGDILNYTGTCSNGCSTLGQDRSITVSLTANTPYTFCVRKGGSVCIRNPSTAAQAITVAVQVAGTTAINVTIPVGESRCFHSNDDCDETFNDCQ